MTGKDILSIIGESSGQERLRYAPLLEGFPPTEDLRVFSAPGRTELGGNHTDHNRGKVLAAAIQMDAVAVVAPRGDRRVLFRSAGFPDIDILPDLSPKAEERGSTAALIRGIAAGFAARGVQVGGFSANVSSMVLPGSGLSSSAAIEVLIAKIFDALYGGGKCSPIELAMICRKAENDFFGKPSGLMDQAASAIGGVVAIDFAEEDAPLVSKIDFDPAAEGLAFCVVNTGGSHADLTPDYAAIPGEMIAVARYFGTSFLGELGLSQVLSEASAIRKKLGDRALLRAIHFFNENRRVEAMIAAKNMGEFLGLVNESGDSSWELLQNMYSPATPGEQGLTLALAVSREFFRERGYKTAACRVHGGGFAGGIQAYVPADGLDTYRARMEAVFGPGALTVLQIRPLGAVEITLT